MTLLNGERVIDRLDSCGVILTTHRIRVGTDRDFTSIMLEQVCSIAVQRVAQTWLLAAGLALLVGVAITAEYRRIGWEAAAGVAASELVLIACYLLSRFHVLQIASAGARISVRLPRRKYKAESVLRLIDAIEFAKSERVSVLSETRWERTG